MKKSLAFMSALVLIMCMTSCESIQKTSNSTPSHVLDYKYANWQDYNTTTHDEDSIYINATFSESGTYAGNDYFVANSEDGEWVIGMAFYKDPNEIYNKIKNKNLTIYGLYSGMSENKNLPVIHAEYIEYDDITLQSNVNYSVMRNFDKSVYDKLQGNSSQDSSSKKSTTTNTTTTKATTTVSTEFLNALDKAESYSKNLHMSKSAIYKQLTSDFEGFGTDAAQYAIDNLKADYNYNALQKAKSYSENLSMSKNSIYNQLTSDFEGFTPDEAQYAIDNLD